MKVVVIGGGAAGFFGAIACANTHPHTKVILLEAGQQPLAKVRISGGGRCNVTHACFDPAQFVQNYPRGAKALRGAFSRFQAKDTVEWFTQKGVELKTEEDGRMFPITDDSETIVNCLIQSAKQAGIQIKTQARVTEIHVNQKNHDLSINPVSEGNLKTFIPHHQQETGFFNRENYFKIILNSGEILTADRLLLATGSNPSGYRWAQQLGHQIIPPVPSLFTFNITDERLKDLAGVSVNSAKIKLPEAKLEQTGPLLITHWGLSGPAVLKLSAWGARFLQDFRYKTSLIVNWLPLSNPEALREELLAVKSQLSQRVVSSSCPVLIPRRLWKQLTLAVGIDEQKRWGEVSNKVINQLIQELTQGKFKINGKGVFKEEFVTCGGVSLKEVDFKTMESRCCPNLYFAGEILDIDGVTGGFNFQSAWTTGWLAGQAMGKF
ncbi:NAD(P)/FAD-dependent oxidoreductase [Limnoraphis robusta Tam1]|uniref:NAD(P)/FAD-dependent oxidoreductase n=1 Tax=Limnoraphis robusta TaxID=1118279 RepID=UPI002B20D05E|nr:NAD(P)/FAD-dependent oxidoreductase [Limnoraphis robusta]MEA5499441.1 NAD(P)/FAD-dependent oxidoreductase [Limnoraphis robusta BA-68 BA1]MEA5541814.1 NAD(P)/FAD-dependent oxidoreductase [Limnoraphis robusta Tam1]